MLSSHFVLETVNHSCVIDCDEIAVILCANLLTVVVCTKDYV